MVKRDDDTRITAAGRRTPPWQTYGLLALGVWLMISHLLLHDGLVTAALVSGLLSGLALVGLAAWAGAVHRPLTPWLFALNVGLWLLVVPSFWQFRDGADTWQLIPSLLVPLPGVRVVEPTIAAIDLADWNSILSGLLVIGLAVSVLVAARRRRGRSSSAGSGHQRPAQAPGR
jgi:hypothetical protein